MSEKLIWRNSEGLTHRDDDLPAIIEPDGTQYWFQNGLKHRDGDQPAVIKQNGTKIWYQNGQRHRDGDEPAVIDADGSKEWYKNGKSYKPNLYDEFQILKRKYNSIKQILNV